MIRRKRDCSGYKMHTKSDWRAKKLRDTTNRHMDRWTSKRRPVSGNKQREGQRKTHRARTEREKKERKIDR